MTTRRTTIRPLPTLFALLLLALSLVALLPTAEAQYQDRIRGVIWDDLNCDGIRQDAEPLMPNIMVTLRYAGIWDEATNQLVGGEIHADAPDIQYTALSLLLGNYAFSLAGQGEPYFISIRGEDKPVGYVPAPFQAGDDRTRDNDMTVGLLPGTPLWATPVFWMPEDRRAVVTGIDIGLCRVETHTVYLPLVVR